MGEGRGENTKGVRLCTGVESEGRGDREDWGFGEHEREQELI